MEYCPHCMKPASGEVCQHCGGQMNWTAGPGQLPLGTLLRGSKNQTYMIGAARGQGGFGITYAAMNLNTSERVAIKEYYPTHCSTRTTLNQVMPMTGQDQVYRNGIKSFLEEAMMLSAVGALPSVVTVMDYFEANGTAYLVMEYIDGIPLHEVVSRRGKIPAAELMPKLEPLLQDLAILHKARVIHRDISPDNLMLMPNGSLKLLDFGSARSVQDGKAMTVLLKAGFSPVEQYQSRGQGPWTDVYALAGTIYYCLTGVIPPTAVDRLDDDDLVAPNALGAQLTPAQEKALLWGLTVQPKARPADMEAFRRQLLEPGASSVHTQQPKKRTQTTVKETPLPKDPGNESASDTGHTSFKADEQPVPRQEASPARKKPPKWLFFVAGGVAMLLLLAVIGINHPDGSDRDTSQDKAQSNTLPAEVKPGTSMEGTTEDGYTYKINADRTECIITGYTGTETLLEIPNTVDNVPVTVIDENAFSGLKSITHVTFQSNLKEIRNKAFAGCTSLKGLLIYGNTSPAANAFANCHFLRYALLMDDAATPDAWSLLDRVHTYRHGMETGIGPLDEIVSIDKYGVIYGSTTNKEIVVLDIPGGIEEISIPTYIEIASDTTYPVKWIYADALEHADSSIEITLPAETLFSYQLWDQANWLFNADGNNYTAKNCTTAQCWYISCLVCSGINEQRPANTPEILPDKKLLRAAISWAKKLVASDNAGWSPEDYDISCRYSTKWKDTLTAYEAGIDSRGLRAAFEELIEAYTPTTAGQQTYYTNLCLGLSYDHADNRYHLTCLVIGN